MSFFSTIPTDFEQIFAESLNELKSQNTAKIEANNAKKHIDDLFEIKRNKLDYTTVNLEIPKLRKVTLDDFKKPIFDLVRDTIKNIENIALFKKSYYKLIDHLPVINLVFGEEFYNDLARIFNQGSTYINKEARNWIFLFETDFEGAMQIRKNQIKPEQEIVESPNKFKMIEGTFKTNPKLEYAKKMPVDYKCEFKLERLPFLKETVKTLKVLEKDEIYTTVAILNIEEKTKLSKKVSAHFAYIEPKTYKNLISFLRNNTAHNYGSISEILNDNVRFFCDIDDKENKLTKESFIDHCRLIVDNFKTCFSAFFCEFPEIKDKTIEVQPIVLFPAIWKYNSCHLIFDVRINDAPLCFADASQQKSFWMSFLFLFPALKAIFDLSVYSKNRYMRLPYSYKNGQYLIRSDLLCTYKKKVLNDLFICINDENKLRLDYPCDYSSRPKYWTEFEKRELLRNIRNCDVSIAKRKDWLFLVSVICSAFKEESLEFCQGLVIKICAAAGFKDKKDIEENIEIVEVYYNRKPNVKFAQAIDFFSANCNFDKTDVFEKIDYSSFPKNKIETVLVKSGCNTQKTYNFMQNYKTGTFYVTHRCSLAEDYFNTFDDLDITAVHYKDYAEQKKIYDQLIEAGEEEAAAKMVIPNNKGLFVPINFVCQLNSIYKYYDILPYYERFFFDECAATFKMINFCIDNGKKGSSVYFKMAFNFIIENKSIFCVSANLGYETFNLLEYYGRKATFSLHNTRLDKSEYYYELYEDKKEFLAQVKAFLLQNKKVIMPCNNLKVAAAFQEELIKLGYKVLLISKYSKLIQTSEWREYDAVLMTPKIDSGVSYRGYNEEKIVKTGDNIKMVNVLNGHFDKVCGYFEKNSNDSESCFQSLWRARNPKDKDIHIFISQT